MQKKGKKTNSIIKLSNYNNKLVKITDINNLVFEGMGYYNNALYNLHEYGREEDSIQILNYNFYKSTIKKIRSIKKYSSPYSDLEKDLITDFSLLEDVILDEDDDVVNRVLDCLKDENKLNKDICKLLKKKCKNTESNELKEKMKKIIKQK